ncbi:MAG: hypothetical protein ACLRSW_02630 [Christensenellaceae bacterium]
MKKKKNLKKTYTYIGGQAVMEGVMMRGRQAMATAVRDPKAIFQIERSVFCRPKKSRFPVCPLCAGFLTCLLAGRRQPRAYAQRRSGGGGGRTALEGGKMAGGKA